MPVTDLGGLENTTTLDLEGVVKERGSQRTLFSFGYAATSFSPPRPALALLDAMGGVERSLVLPTELAWESAVAVPFVAEILRVWDAVGLDIGVGALIIEPAPWAQLAALGATWYGATPLLMDCTSSSNPTSLSNSEEELVARLGSELGRYPAVCALELTGRSAGVDLVLEAVPRFSRIVFAGAASERLTIDFYTNVHRKGVTLSSTILSCNRIFEVPADLASNLVARASRLLQRADRAAACREALSAVVEIRRRGLD